MIFRQELNTIVRVGARIRMCHPTRAFISADTYVHERRHIRTCIKHLKKANPFRTGLEFLSERTGVFFGPDWSSLQKGFRQPKEEPPR